MTQFSKSYDLEERTARFGESVISFCMDLPRDTITAPLISQLIRSSTSIGANYVEANNASSKKDFTNKIFICKKESQETKHWFRMLVRCLPKHENKIKMLWQECHELNLIFQKIISTLQKNLKN